MCFLLQAITKKEGEISGHPVTVVDRNGTRLSVKSSFSAAASIEIISGNRGVILYSYGAGLLHCTKSALCRDEQSDIVGPADIAGC